MLYIAMSEVAALCSYRPKITAMDNQTVQTFFI